MLLRLLIGTVYALVSLQAQSPAGFWKTLDDKTGKPRGTVHIWEEKGEFFGKIVSSLDPKDEKGVCDLCPGERKNKPILGLVILQRIKNLGSEFGGGEILDPETGSVYRCKLRLVENGKKLILRGYLGFSLLGRSQIWLREP